MSTRRSLLLLAMTSSIALPSCMPTSPALIDVQLTVTSEPGIPAVQLPRTTVSTGETATFTVAGREIHITPSLKHGLVILQAGIDVPARNAPAEKASEPLAMTTAAGAGRIVTLRVDTTTIAIEAMQSLLSSPSPEQPKSIGEQQRTP